MMRRAHPSRRPRDGFTLIEVMIALAILTVGAVGIVALQRASTRGNMSARQMTTATQVSKTWVERLRRDALMWTQPGDPAAVAPGNQYLAPIDGTWRVPVPVLDPTESAGATWFGNDALPGDAVTYCTHVSMQWVDLNRRDTIRADVRTYWSRRSGGQSELVTNGCSQGTEPAVTAELASLEPALSAVHTSALLRWTPTQ